LGAALNGHEGVVKILLASDEVNPDQPDKDGQAPLLCAAWNGHVEVVKLLTNFPKTSKCIRRTYLKVTEREPKKTPK